MNGLTLGIPLRLGFAQGARRGLGFADRVTPQGWLWIDKEQFGPSRAEMPFDVIGQHTDQDMCAHARFEIMVDRPNLQIALLERTKGAFNASELLIGSYDIGAGELGLLSARAQDVDSVESSLCGNLLGLAWEGETVVLDL